ncbi:MAG TPA: hypothetical protein VGZ25_13200 [Gemmataceae bacterium]|jgi:hypothetical protein|nr:hypothetical protein [Gemmataceae bacterium]
MAVAKASYYPHPAFAVLPAAQRLFSGERVEVIFLRALASTQERFLRELTYLHDDDPPDRTTLLRWLKRATQQGQICRGGAGYRSDPYLYWLPGREPLLYPGDQASEEEKNAWRERWAAHKRAQQQASLSTVPP